MKSTEFVTEGITAETRFRDTFNAAGVVLQSIQMDDYDDNWIKVSAKGNKHFRAGIQEKIQFIINCWWEPTSNEISGIIKSQGSSYDKKYSKELDLEYDQFTLEEFANKVNTFISDIAKAQTTANADGEREYWKNGGTGMMPGSVTRK